MQGLDWVALVDGVEQVGDDFGVALAFEGVIPVHQGFAQGLLVVQAAMVHDGDHLLGDRHVDAVTLGEREDRLAALHPLAGLLRRLDRLGDGEATAEVDAE